MKFSNVKIGVRLGAAFGAVLLLMAAMTAVGLWELTRIGAAKDDMRAAAYKHQLTEQWLGAIASNAVRTYARVKSASPDDEKFFESAMKSVSARITEIQKELEPLLQTEEGKRLFAEVGNARKVYSAARDAAFALKKSAAGPTTEVNAAVEQKMVPAMNNYIAAVQAEATFQKKLVEQADNAIDTAYAEARTLLLALGAAALALGALLAWRLTRSITVPLGRAVAVAETVAAGDLTSDIDASAHDEVGRLLAALKAMNTSLLSTVREVRTGTDTIATAAKEIAAGNMDLSVRTEQQASSLEETAASLEEMTSTVKANAENARQANTLAMSASQVAVRGGTVVSEVVGTMASINASSRQIVDIISVIDGIAFQTNILALNAAVEAARAGEQGRGFAVVASEVRTLAQRSAAAAKEIKILIDNSVQQVEAGGKLVGQAGTTMNEIVASIARVTDIMGEIAHASVEQTLGIDQINMAITQMDEVTQQNAAMVEEAASAAAALEVQAEGLAQVVSVFTIDHHAGQPALRRPAASRALALAAA